MPLAAFFLLLIAACTTVVVKCADNDDQSIRSLSSDELKMADEAGYSYVDRLTQLEEDLARGGHVNKARSYFTSRKKPSPEVVNLARSNMRFIETVRYLKNEFGLNDQEIDHNLERFANEANTSCLAPAKCFSLKYRTMDGSCNSNNANLTNLGRSVTTFRRLLRPDYLDGISTPRTNATNRRNALPSARLVSTVVFDGSDDSPLSNITNLMMQFGQFINHDMEFTDQYSLQCCTDNHTQFNSSYLKSLGYCFPISVPTNDPFLNNIPGKKPVVRETCMEFVRSFTGPNRLSCKFPIVKYADQLNFNTHWLDASVVYGSNNATSSFLRNPSNGLMATSTDSTGRQLLPTTKDCLISPSPCFAAGDLRSQVQPQMTVMQTVWMREHNRIAKILSKLNPKWNKETVFQETRRIVIAEYQHITYNEFLPILLGKTAMTKYGLTPLKGSATFDGYNTDNLTSGPISNEFATAAYRMGHSLVQGVVELVDASGKLTKYNMSDNFFNATLFYSDKYFVDKVIRGFARQHSQTVDTKITDELWLKMFVNILSTTRSPPVGALDIVALNTQRGRDHGIPSYNSYFKMCGQTPLVDPISKLPTNIRNRSDKSTPYFDKKVVEALAKVYTSVNDIDLYVGGLAELSTLGDGIMGPTFTCLIAENFRRLKYSDRYFYESKANPYPFKPEQLTEIKKASMARIFCDNNEGTLTTIQPQVFLVAGNKNKPAPCKSTTAIPSLNLNRWAY